MEKKTLVFGSESASESDKSPVSGLTEGSEQDQSCLNTDADQSGFKNRNERDDSLKVSEERYRSLFDKTTIGIYHTTPDGRVIMANPAACRMMGYDSFEELADVNLENGKFMPSYSRDQFRKLLEADGEIIGLESTWTRRDGSTLYVRENSRVVKDPDGSILYYEGTIEDITDKKIAEDKLKASEEKFRKAFENAQDIYLHTDIEGKIIEISPAIKRTLNFKREELLGKLADDIFINADHLKDLLKELEEKGEVFDYEMLLKNKTNEVVWTSVNAHFLYDSNNNRIGVEGNIHDISKRKLVEEELRKLSRAVEQSPVSIVITDTAGNIEYANPKTCQTTGYTIEELKGQNPRVLKSGETNSLEYTELWALISSGKEWRGLFHNKRKNGELYWESSNISPITDSEGKITHYVAVKEDVTEKKAIEKALIESEEKYRTLAEDLREMNTTKDKLFSIIAHDMRGPIGSFIQVLDILTGDMEMDKFMRHDLLEELSNSSKNIFNLLENLLNWSKIQRSIITLHPRKFRLTDSLRENIDLLGPNSKQKGINTILNAEENIIVFADKDTISLVLRNLISNAVKFTPERGTIQISADSTGVFCEVSIKDSGVGMTKDVLENLFRPGSYYSSFGTNGERGSGIGLVLVKDFVERNGGILKVESVPGEGSRFIFTIPKVRRD
jgi:PAS domain S-box-containing protein